MKSKKSLLFKDAKKRMTLPFLLFGLLLLSQAAIVSATEKEICQELFGKVKTENDPTKIDIEIETYLALRKEQDTMGVVRSKVSKDFQTTFYYTATGLPTKDKGLPFVDPSTKAVFVFFQGAGTGKASGRNFLHNMNLMAGLGFGSVSFDYPFHADGPKDWSLADTDKFMNWVDEILKEVKKSKKPIYLVGHSFGPSVIFEYLSRHPFSVDGALGMSPSNFNDTLKNWFRDVTSQLDLKGRKPNVLGSRWSSSVSSGSGWMHGALTDPTIANKNLRLRILSGDEEEFVPSKLDENNKPFGKNTYDISRPLQRLFTNAEIVIEPGVGHKLFNHKDKNGDNVVLREMLSLVGMKPGDVRSREIIVKAQKENRTPVEQVAALYLLDDVFKLWVNNIYGKDRVFHIYRTQDGVTATRMMDGYKLASKATDLKITKLIIETKVTHPEFYDLHRGTIDMAAKKNQLLNHLFAAYYNYLYNKNSESQESDSL